jgi:hypothetical protein
MDAPLDECITDVITSADPTLGMSKGTAQTILEAIQDSDRDDHAALQAYDLLHQRVTVGRAW